MSARSATALHRVRLAAGLCRSCGATNPDAGRRLCCPECRAEANAKRKAKIHARVEQGVCVNCQGKPLPGKTRCETCHAAHSWANEAYHEQTRRPQIQERKRKRKGNQ